MANKIGQGGEVAQQAYMASVAGLAGITDEAKRNEAGVALFGTMWEDLRDQVVFAMSDSTNAVEGYEGSTQEVLDSLTQGPINRMKQGWRGLVTGVAEMVNSNATIEEFSQTVSDGFNNVIPYIESGIEKAIGFGNTIRTYWSPIKETVIGITIAVAAFKVGMATMGIVQTVTGFIQAYRAATAAGTVAQWALNTAMSANPIGVVIALVAALVAGGVLLYRNWDTVSQKMDTAWNLIKQSAATAINFVIDGINALIKTINVIPGVNIPLIAKVDWGSESGPAKGLALASEKNRSHSKTNATTTLASYDVGTNRVTKDQTANIHKDEMIIPARQAAKVRAAGGNIDNVASLIGNGGNGGGTSKTDNQTGGNTYQFGNIIIQTTSGNGEEIAAEFVRQVEMQLANL